MNSHSAPGEWARLAIRPHVSTQTFNRLRYAWWLLRFYALRQLTSARAIVEGSSSLAQELAGVNVARPTAFCRTMTRHGSDKGRGWHTYTTVYSVLLGHSRREPLRIFELGIGTNNPHLVSTMGVEGTPGASLRGWRDLFPRARIYGADIDRAILFSDDRIETFYCDQLDADAIRSLWSEPALREPFDLIIDDGLHTFAGNRSFLEHSIAHLRPGGLYIVEDITRTALDDWRGWIAAHPQTDIALVQLPNPLNWLGDNNLLLIRVNQSAVA